MANVGVFSQYLRQESNPFLGEIRLSCSTGILSFGPKRVLQRARRVSGPGGRRIGTDRSRDGWTQRGTDLDGEKHR